jgi:hypothetical protein
MRDGGASVRDLDPAWDVPGAMSPPKLVFGIVEVDEKVENEAPSPDGFSAPLAENANLCSVL